MDASTVAITLAIVGLIGTIYTTITGRKTAREGQKLTEQTITREDWDTTLLQARADRDELRREVTTLRKENGQLTDQVLTFKEDNTTLKVKVIDLSAEVKALRSDLDIALGHVSRCEDELVRLRGSQ